MGTKINFGYGDTLEIDLHHVVDVKMQKIKHLQDGQRYVEITFFDWNGYITEVTVWFNDEKSKQRIMKEMGIVENIEVL